MDDVLAPIVDSRMETIDTSDARREWWFGDLYSQLYNVVDYANSAMSLVEVRDPRGLRYTAGLLVLKARLAQAAIDQISKIDAVGEHAQNLKDRERARAGAVVAR